LVRIFKSWIYYILKSKHDPKKDFRFTSPDDTGVIFILNEDGSKSDIGIQTIDSDMVEAFQLIDDNTSMEQAKEIVKQRKRDKKLNKLLNDERKG
jgi:hypothetical protein